MVPYFHQTLSTLLMDAPFFDNEICFLTNNNTFSVSRALWGTFYWKSFPVIRFVCSYNELCSLWMGVAFH